MKYQQHYLSAAYPAMSADEYQALRDSIIGIGVQHPITIYDGQVIDGWHRYKAAAELGMDCPEVQLGDVDPRDFAKSQGARRNITPSQQAIAITSIYLWVEPARKNNSLYKSTTCSIVPGLCPPKTNAELATIAGVSEATIQRAKVAHTAGLADEVRSGAITVKQAAQIARPPKPVEPPKQIEAPEPEDYSKPDEHEIASLLAEEKLNIAKFQEILNSDDALAEACKENERLRLELVVVKSTRDGYMNQISEMTRIIRALRNKIARAGI
jgi:hypothetical protein